MDINEFSVALERTTRFLSDFDASLPSDAEVLDALRDVAEIEESAAAFEARLREHLAGDCHTPVVE